MFILPLRAPQELGWENKRPVLVGSLLSSTLSFLSSYTGSGKEGEGQSTGCFISARAQGLSRGVVTRASLSAEDEVDMLNGAHGSEERISVPSCYGGIGAPVSRQGECRRPKGSESLAAGKTPVREAVRGMASPPACWVRGSCFCSWLTVGTCLHPRPVQSLAWHEAAHGPGP